MIVEKDASLLCVIDLQERLLPAIHEGERALANSLKLVEAARRLSVPLLCSEQYPKGLGHSVPALREALKPEEIMEKVHFSCAKDPEIQEFVRHSHRRQLVLCGTEAHVCVLQSALGFKQKGYEVFVVLDAVSSRRSESVAAASDRLRLSGIPCVTTEMVLFEWLDQAATPEFRALRDLIV